MLLVRKGEAVPESNGRGNRGERESKRKVGERVDAQDRESVAGRKALLKEGVDMLQSVPTAILGTFWCRKHNHLKNGPTSCAGAPPICSARV